MSNLDKTRVLVAPLDWGLGHTTRCIPLISELLKADYEVIVAGEGKIKTVLQLEFPFLKFLSLKGYDIQYGKTSTELFFKVLYQIPKILSAINNERKWLNKIIEEEKIDIVISDNRYGLYNESATSVFITHQLRIQASFLTGFLQQLNYRFINRFDACWVPDYNGAQNMAGVLSHPKSLPIVPIRYIGLLSRFSYTQKEESSYLLVLLSGPEPQRTILEKKLLVQLEKYKQPVVFVRGLPGSDSSLDNRANNIRVHNHLSSEVLQEVIKQASFVIARSGYSTVMDLIKMRKKSILIATPGQTEQQYLAKHLFENRLAVTMSQKDFDLETSLKKAQSFSYQLNFPSTNDLLKNAITDLRKKRSSK